MTRFRYWKLTSDEVKKLTHDPDKILIIGDSPGDLKAAQNINALFFPILPLEEEKISKTLAGILGGFLGGFLSVFFFVFRKLFKDTLGED